MTTKTTKTIIFAVLFTALLIPFSGINGVEAITEKSTVITDECFDRITESASEQESKLDVESLKHQAVSNSQFNQLKGDKAIEFKNTIQYWKADPVNCTAELKQIDVKYAVEKDTKNHKELIVSIDGDSRNIIKSEIKELYDVDHTNYTGDQIAWAGITQLHGTVESSSLPTKARAFFDVPSVSDPAALNCGTGTNRCILSVWAGLSEDWGGSDTMIQSGTDSHCEGNNCGTSLRYNAWLQKVDTSAPPVDECTGMTVNAGDSVRAYTYYYDSTDKYSAGVFNYDEFDVCTTSYTSETEHAHYGQFIVERPDFSGNNVPLPAFTDFNMIGEIEISGSYQGIGDYNTMGHTWKHTMKNSGTTNIEPSWPNTSTDEITFDYQSSSGAT